MEHSPVTHTAEVDVKRASKKDAPPDPAVEIGSISRKHPMRITITKPKLMILNDEK